MSCRAQIFAERSIAWDDFEHPFGRDPSRRPQSFRLDHGNFETIAPPDSFITFALTINNMGTIGGAYLDTNFIAHGFLFRNGVFTTIDVPGALQTKIDSINELGELAGGYGLVDGTFHGFVATLESGQLNDTTMEPADAEPVNMSDVNSSRQ